MPRPTHAAHLSVGLGDTLQFVLLLDGVRVAGTLSSTNQDPSFGQSRPFRWFQDKYLGGVDELVGQALGNRLDVAEGSLASASAQQPDGLRCNENRHSKGQSPVQFRGEQRARVVAWLTRRSGETSTA